MRDKIVQMIFAVLADHNTGREVKDQILLSEETSLFGKNSSLDSMELVTILLDVEQSVSQEFDFPLTIMDERAMSEKYSPFRTIAIVRDTNE